MGSFGCMRPCRNTGLLQLGLREQLGSVCALVDTGYRLDKKVATEAGKVDSRPPREVLALDCLDSVTSRPCCSVGIMKGKVARLGECFVGLALRRGCEATNVPYH